MLYCESCKISFEHLYEFFFHREFHFLKYKNKNSCCFCSQSFLNEDQLKTHLQDQHSDQQYTEPKLICHMCGIWCTFKEQSDLDAHIALHALNCSICSNTFSEPAFLLEHLKYHTNENLLNEATEAAEVRTTEFQCDICGNYFSTKSSIGRHLRKHPRRNLRCFKCDLCGETFRKKIFLSAHRVHDHNLSQFKCDICGKLHKTTSNDHHIGDIRSPNPNSSYVQCTECCKRFPSKEVLEIHRKCHPHCMYCSRIFKTGKALKMHIGRTHPTQIA